jgi:hypothetical protein
MIRLEPWSTSAERELSRVDKLDIEETRSEIERGISQLWHCQRNGAEGFAVTKLRKREDGSKEWIWVACAGRGFHEFVSDFLDAAYEMDVEVWVMVHSAAMRRIYHRLGFSDATFVLRANEKGAR